MLVVSPLFSTLWVRMLHEWHVPIGAAGVQARHQVSWAITIVYGLSLVRAYRLDAASGICAESDQVCFLGVSYFLWYFTSFTTEYLLVFAVAHRIMHGVQYIVMVYYYNRHKVERGASDSIVISFLSKRGNIKAFLLMCGAYALVFHALSEGHVRDFGFGFVGFNTNFDLFSYSLLSSFALIHYYYDAFIWKVRKKDVQEGLQKRPPCTSSSMRYLRSFKLLLIIVSIGALLAYVERERTSEYGHLSERTHARTQRSRASPSRIWPACC